MDVTVTTVSLPEDSVILSVQSKDTKRQFHLNRGSRSLHFPWSLSGELNLQLFKEASPQETIVLDQYLELGSQEERVEIGDAVLSISVLPAAPKRHDVDRQSAVSDRDRDRKYLEDTGLSEVLSASLGRILKERPENPCQLLISDLQEAMRHTHK